ncbi:helix-turn-helix transcriptional regulator [Saccharopolyspora taberi]|uniref:Helix-turn-helix transcriptional regulator n=2 Tax=Saccharopolyspora taberi TaxID=60895 RepID=A0ABN3VRF6_9PSEU
MPEIASVRRALLRHESGKSTPKRADDLYVQVYALAYAKQPDELFGHLRPVPSADGTFGVRSHKFIPAYLGEEIQALIEAVDAQPTTVGWAECHRAEIAIDPGPGADQGLRGVLYVFGWGVAVLHVIEPLRPASVAELALWRRRTHRSARKLLSAYLSALMDSEVIAPYVLTCLWLHDSAWSGDDLHTAMRLLCMPRALLGVGEDEHDGGLAHAEAIEKRLFRDGFAPADHVDCGVDGVSIGWASWSGVAYYPVNARAALTEEDLATCELLAQALWCLCNQVSEQVRAGVDPVLPAGHNWRWLRGRRAEITNAGATEPQQLRALRNAVLETSELSRMLGETVELLREIEQ